MIVCETEFDKPDPKSPKYSLTEVDFYGHLPYPYRFPNHRLTLRKNLETGEYEAIRFYHRTEKVEVAFKSRSFREVMDFINGEVSRFWGSVFEDREPDRVCEHKPPNLAYWRCKIWEQMPTEEKIKILKGERRKHLKKGW